MDGTTSDTVLGSHNQVVGLTPSFVLLDPFRCYSLGGAGRQRGGGPRLTRYSAGSYCPRLS